MSPCGKSAFTLIELSIVLVIIGLLVGGVMAGAHLINAAKLHRIGSTVEQYRTAVLTFKSKYNGLPGDLSNATAFWGTNPEGCPNSWGAAGPYVTGTCNGNGNGIIGPSVLWTNDVPPTAEWARFWHHLSNAGLIPGTYCSRDG